jgi:hypothetical protein
MSAYPQYAATPIVALGQVATANTNRDGTGTLATILTAGTSGTRIDQVVVEGTGTSTAGMVRLFIYDGTNTRMFDEVPIAAVTPSASVACFRQVNTYGIVLPAGYLLKASVHNAETYNVTAIGANY